MHPLPTCIVQPVGNSSIIFTLHRTVSQILSFLTGPWMQRRKLLHPYCSSLHIALWSCSSTWLCNKSRAQCSAITHLLDCSILKGLSMYQLSTHCWLRTIHLMCWELVDSGCLHLVPIPKALNARITLLPMRSSLGGSSLPAQLMVLPVVAAEMLPILINGLVEINGTRSIHHTSTDSLTGSKPLLLELG